MQCSSHRMVACNAATLRRCNAATLRRGNAATLRRGNAARKCVNTKDAEDSCVPYAPARNHAHAHAR